MKDSDSLRLKPLTHYVEEGKVVCRGEEVKRSHQQTQYSVELLTIEPSRKSNSATEGLVHTITWMIGACSI